MFATTKALAFQRSAELARSFKNVFLRPEEFEYFACMFIRTCRVLKFVYTILSIFFPYLLSGMPDRRYGIFVILL